MSEKLETNLRLGSPEHPVRFSYAYVFEPRESDDEDEDGKKKLFYSIMVLIPKEAVEDLQKMRAIIKALVDEKFQGKTLNLQLPLRDGDQEYEEKGDFVKGHWFFSCKSKTKPMVVGTQKDELTDKLIPLTPGAEPEQFKSGDYGRITVRLYAFSGKKKGVAVGLGNIQKLKNGESLSGQRSADEDFGDLADGFKD